RRLAALEIVGEVERCAHHAARKQERQRVLQAIREREGCVKFRLDPGGIAGGAKSHRTNAICTDAHIVSGKGIREPMWPRGVITPYPLAGECQHVRSLACEVRVTPAVVQRLEFKVIVTELLADREQLVAAEFGLVVTTITRRVHI